MSAKNLSTVATDLIESYGNTAKNVIHAYRAGGERVVSLLENRWNKALKESRPQLDAEVAKNAAAAQLSFSVYYSKGLIYTSHGAQQLVTQLVKLAEAGIDSAAANASRFEEKTGLTTLSTIAKTTAPGAVVLSKLASQIEQKSAVLARKIAGDPATTVRVKRSSAFKARRTTGKTAQTAAWFRYFIDSWQRPQNGRQPSVWLKVKVCEQSGWAVAAQPKISASQTTKR